MIFLESLPRGSETGNHRVRRYKPGQAQEGTKARSGQVSTRTCRRLESARRPEAPTGQARAEAAADPVALEAGAARAPGHPGHHSGERPWSVIEAHFGTMPAQVTPHPPPPFTPPSPQEVK